MAGCRASHSLSSLPLVVPQICTTALPRGDPSTSSPGRDDSDDKPGAGRVTNDAHRAGTTLRIRIQHDTSRIRRRFQRPCRLKIRRTRVTAAAAPDVLGILIAPPQPLSHVDSPVTSDIVAQCQTDERTVVGEQRPERFVTPKLPCRFVDQPTHRPPRPSPTNKLHGWVCLSAIVSARRTRASRTGAASSSVGFVHGIIPAVGLCLCFRRCLCHGSGRRRPPAALVGPPDGLGLP